MSTIRNVMPYKLFFFVFCAVFLLGCSDGGSKAHPWLKGIGRTEDLTPVDLVLRSNHETTNGHTLKFLIPKSYLTRKVNWLGGEQESIEIQTGLPDLLARPAIKSSRTKISESDYQSSQDYTDNGVYIRLERPSISKDHFNESDMEKKLYAFGSRSRYSRDYEKQENVYGLEFYKAHFCHQITKECRERIGQFFITPLDYDKHWLTFSCSRLELNPSGGCTVKTQYRRKRLTYIFRRTQLYRWQEFDAAVRRLLDNFLIEESEINRVR